MNNYRKNNDFITYTIDKGFTSNLAISVQNGQVAVSAPWYFSTKRINQIIVEKKDWILQKIKEYNTDYEPKTIKVFNQNLDVIIDYKGFSTECLYKNNQIVIVLPITYKGRDNSKTILAVINKFYQTLAEKEVERIMEKNRIRFNGLAPNDYRVEKIDSALGRFIEENKEIIINPDIIKFDKEILEYVVLHEFCHIKYKTHAKSFYKIIEKYIPNYKNIETKIKGLF